MERHAGRSLQKTSWVIVGNDLRVVPFAILDSPFFGNAALNGIGEDRLRVCAGDIISDASLREYLGTGYDLVLANIVAHVIIPLSAVARRFMAENGVFICSGIIEHRWPETADALRANGFEIINHLSDEEWHCFVCR